MDTYVMKYLRILLVFLAFVFCFVFGIRLYKTYVQKSVKVVQIDAEIVNSEEALNSLIRFDDENSGVSGTYSPREAGERVETLLNTIVDSHMSQLSRISDADRIDKYDKLVGARDELLTYFPNLGNSDFWFLKDSSDIGKKGYKWTFRVKYSLSENVIPSVWTYWSSDGLVDRYITADYNSDTSSFSNVVEHVLLTRSIFEDALLQDYN